MWRQKQKKHERDFTEAIGNEAEMSKYLNRIRKKQDQKGHWHNEKRKWKTH